MNRFKIIHHTFNHALFVFHCIGSITTLYGKFFTNIFDDLQQSLEEDSGSSYYIKRYRFAINRTMDIHRSSMANYVQLAINRNPL